MTSSSTERGFFSAERGSIVRLLVVIAIGAAALVGPVAASTSARFSDSDRVGVPLYVPGTPTPTPTPTP